MGKYSLVQNIPKLSFNSDPFSPKSPYIFHFSRFSISPSCPPSPPPPPPSHFLTRHRGWINVWLWETCRWQMFKFIMYDFHVAVNFSELAKSRKWFRTLCLFNEIVTLMEVWVSKMEKTVSVCRFYDLFFIAGFFQKTTGTHMHTHTHTRTHVFEQSNTR